MINERSQDFPMDNIIKIVGKKWTIPLIKDMLSGKKQFKEFLISNKGLTNKILSLRLKEMEDVGLVEKYTFETNSHITEYFLTENGKKVDIIYEMGNYMINNMNENHEQVKQK
jgi:DNA-binding HxlR family transcriptional regulator